MQRKNKLPTAIFKMACSPIFGFFRNTFFSWLSLGPMGQLQCISSTMEHFLGVWQPFWLIYKQLQEIDTENMKFHWNRTLIVVTSCEVLNSLKKYKKYIEYTRTRCPKVPELKNLKKSHLLFPRVNLYLQNPLLEPIGRPRLTFLYGTPRFWNFW